MPSRRPPPPPADSPDDGEANSINERTDVGRPAFSVPEEPSDPYGEGDYPPEEESYREPVKQKSKGPAGHNETRVAPMGDVIEEEEDDDSPDATNAGPPIKLEIIGGPDEGRVRRFKGVRMVVGRTIGCDLTLSDESVSRRHLELVKGEQGVLLRDLGSGNGTKVNGEKVSEQILQHGDEVALGKTKFRFVDDAALLKKLSEEVEVARKEKEEQAAREEEEARRQEEAQRQAEAEAAKAQEPAQPIPDTRLGRLLQRAGWYVLEPMQQRAVMAGMVLFLLLALFLVFLIRPPPPRPPNPREVLAAKRLEEARVAFEASRFEEAFQLLEQAERLRPGVDSQKLVEKVRVESEAQSALDAARAALAEGRLDDVKASLDKVSDQSSRVAERQTLLATLSNRRAEQVYERAMTALDRQDASGAERLLASVPPELRAELGPKLGEIEARIAEVRKNSVQRAVEQQDERRRKSVAEREAQFREAFAAVGRKFHAGEYDRALLECDRVLERHSQDADILNRANALKRLIPSFERNLEDGARKYRANALQAAIVPLRKARELYQDIGFSGALGPRIDEDLASALVAAGDDALGKDDLSTAARHYREALKLVRQEGRAKDGLVRAQRRSEQIYLEAVKLQDSDPKQAAGLLSMVVDVLPSTSATYKKSKELLSKLRP